MKEMFLGYRDEFGYMRCSKCGCLQISEVPENLSKYYPPEYYSFRKKRDHWIKAFFKRKRAIYAFTGKSWIGRLLTLKYGTPVLVEWAKQWIMFAGVNLNDAILDVGSGNGYYLLDFEGMGFSNLTGVDPFIKGDEILSVNVKVIKCDLAEIQGMYDFVMLHHSFEHVADVRSQLQHLNRLLKPNHFLLIRTPVADSYGWRTYGTDWVGLDAPRHLSIHTSRSIRLLAEETGFELVDVVYDSDEMQIWASEQYKMNIPLQHPSSYFMNPRKSRFSREQIETYKAKAAELNKNRDGDSAAFYLRKI